MRDPLLNRAPNTKLDVTINKERTNKHSPLYNIIKGIIGIIDIVSFVGIFYYFIPGFQHLGTQGTSWQPTYGFVCIVVFLIAVQLAPNKKEN